jgi:uncharacterized protein YfdQ (DUF2303 family)
MTDEIRRRTEADAIAEVAQLAAETQILTLADDDDSGLPPIRIAAVPKGTTLTSLKKFFDEFAAAPERRKGTAKFLDLASFITHANRFKDEHSAIFANPTLPNPTLTVVLDYHPKGEPDAENNARYGEHRGEYLFPVSPEWKAWKGQSGVGMTQAEFAQFLEDHLVDVVDAGTALESARAFASSIGLAYASPAKLLELSRGLTVRVDTKVRNVQNLQSGEASIMFEATHQDEAGAPLKVPGALLIAIPVFRGGDVYQIPARLRYRVRDQRGLSWSYDLHHADRVFDHAFTEACEKAATETGLPVLVGYPESER